MAAIDLNILIAVLVIASVLAYIFVLRKIRTKQPRPVDVAITSTAKQKVPRHHKETPEVQQSEKSSKKKRATKCAYHFGYLSSLPKRSIVPRECLECDRKVGCATGKDQGKPVVAHAALEQ